MDCRMRCAAGRRSCWPSRGGRCRTTSRAWCSRNNSIAPARSGAANRTTSDAFLSRRSAGASWSAPSMFDGGARARTPAARRRGSELKGVSLAIAMPDVVKAARAGGPESAWYDAAPRDASAWRARATAVRDQGAGDWAGALAPAFDASGPAAERLARVARGGIVVTTGQQAGLFGGPIYTWSKALSAIALADAIEAASGIPTAPVFWAATYDADYAESSVTYVAQDGRVVTLAAPPAAVTG